MATAETTGLRSTAVDTGARGTFVRVSDSDPAMLRYLAERGIAPGDELEVVDRQPFGARCSCGSTVRGSP